MQKQISSNALFAFHVGVKPSHPLFRPWPYRIWALLFALLIVEASVHWLDARIWQDVAQRGGELLVDLQQGGFLTSWMYSLKLCVCSLSQNTDESTFRHALAGLISQLRAPTDSSRVRSSHLRCHRWGRAAFAVAAWPPSNACHLAQNCT